MLRQLAIAVWRRSGGHYVVLERRLVALIVALTGQNEMMKLLKALQLDRPATSCWKAA